MKGKHAVTARHTRYGNENGHNEMNGRRNSDPGSTAKRSGGHRSHPGQAARRESGFTLFEVTLTLLIIVMVLGGVLALFDANSRLARSQTHLATMQQSLRVAQYDIMRNVRMTGRGPLLQAQVGAPAEDLHDMLAVALRNNVEEDEHIAIGNTNSPEVVEGTDVLTIRGVFNTPLYQFEPASAYSVTGSPATSGTLIISQNTPTGIPQNLRPLADAVDDTQNGTPEALLVVSPIDDALYAVVELDSGSSYTEEGGEVTQVSLSFNVTGGERTNEYGLISAGGSYPPNMATAAFAGILEEYRYYVRLDREIPGDDDSRLSPHLTRARLYPGTEIAHLEDDNNLSLDVADNVLDLQVAFGIDTQGDEVLVENEPPDGDDDWLFNSADDDSTETMWVTNALGDLSKLFYVRINTLVRTDRQERGFEAGALTTVEDRDYTTAPGNELNTTDQRAFRRTWMQTVVDTRNVS